MSLITTSGQRPGKVRYWLSGLWPFWLFLLLALTVARYLIAYWPLIMLRSVLWQQQLHQHLAHLLYQVQQNPAQAGISLLLFSLVYGVLHAVGPGHGKLVITTYLATHPSQLKLSMAMTLAASLLQGMMAIILVTVMLVVLHLSSGMLHMGEFWLEKSSYILVALLGGLLCRRALVKLRGIIKGLKQQAGPAAGGIVSLYPGPAARPFRVGLSSDKGGEGYRSVPLSPSATHTADCGCGHHHLPGESALRDATRWRTRAAVVLAMGFRPCSGAVLVLLFAKVIGVYAWGMASALVMSAGTAITLLALGLLTFWSRRLAENLTRRHTPLHPAGVAWASLSLAGGLLLIAAGVVLYISAQPAVMGGIRPFSH